MAENLNQSVETQHGSRQLWKSSSAPAVILFLHGLLDPSSARARIPRSPGVPRWVWARLGEVPRDTLASVLQEARCNRQAVTDNECKAIKCNGTSARATLRRP